MLKRAQKILLTVAGLAALALGGSALAGAASNTTTSTSGTGTQSQPSMPQHGTAAHENAEKPVTGTNADKAKAAAEKSVGSGSTATEVTTDFGGNGYEVTVKKSDGSTVEVHLDKSFKVIQGRGPGGRHGGFGGPEHGTAAHENAEKPVTGTNADKAKAAAEKSVGSGSTATEVTTDFGGNGYEVTVKKSDGSTVEVHLDKSFKVMQGGPGGHHGPGDFGPPPSGA